MTQEDLFLTAREAADRLTKAGMTISKDTVQRWCREEKIASVKLPGGYYRIPVEVVDAILKVDPVGAR